MVANFSLAGAVGLVGEVGILVSVAAHNKDHVEKYGHERVAATEKVNEAVDQAIDAIHLVEKMTGSMLNLMPSSHVANAMDRLSYWATSTDKRWDDLFQSACALRDSIKVEFKDHIFYSYPKAKGEKLKAWESEWKKITTAFPDVRVEPYCAVDCYALQHFTASVFHSMRVAECGLRALAKERRISLPKNKAIEWATWQEIIKALDDEIKVIGTTWKAGNAKDMALAFYSGARADLNGFKDEYRNLVMHVRDQYDEFQAARALARVHDFMDRLADKIDHKHHRIRWGRS